MSATDDLLQNNHRYASTHVNTEMSPRPSRGVAVVACMDVRLDVIGALGLQPGEAHILRNAGGVVTDDVLRSLLVSQRLLGTREVMLIHHTRCGMLDVFDDELADAVEQDTGVRPPFALGGFRDLDEDVRRSIRAVTPAARSSRPAKTRSIPASVATARLREVA